MTRPDSLFEAASYDLNKFLERRVADRRTLQRDSSDRRQPPSAQQDAGAEIQPPENTPPAPGTTSH